MKIKPVREWELERYLLGELHTTRMDEIKKMLETDPKLREELDFLKSSSEEILAQYPPEVVVPRIKSQLAEEGRDRAGHPVFLKRLLYATPALAAVLVVLFIVFQDRGIRPGLEMEDLHGTRIKGTEKIDTSKPYILIHRKVDDTVELLESGDRARAGDLLQIAYASVGANYGVILSIDGRGVVTLHYPESEDKDPRLVQEKRALLSSSYELDDAPDFERFFFITSESEIDVQEVLDIAEALAKDTKTAETAELGLPSSISQYSLLIKKGE
jgi:hypothetical protein